MEAMIFEIKRFAVHDGDGIRTTVFFKGCPLKCVWCHNPEGIDFNVQLAYYSHKCVLCGECIKACPVDAHIISNGTHFFNRNLCIDCGVCENTCFYNSLKFYGKKVTVQELMTLLMEDKDFYDTSGGGVTLSGGECLMQADFCAKLLKELKSRNINTAVDTCGFVSRDALDKVIPYTDIFLYDIKAFDEDVHIKCTGYSNKQILKNLKYIDSYDKDIEIRIPYVPGYNDGEMEKIYNFLKKIKNLKKVRVLPYHNYAGTKYDALDMSKNLPDELPSEAEISYMQVMFDNIKNVDINKNL